jgi:hypothetical protein
MSGNSQTTTKKNQSGYQHPGGGKGKGKLFDDDRDLTYREPTDTNDSKVKFPGAIKKNKHVMAVMRDNKTWSLAKIMEIRKSLTEQSS